MKKIIIMATFLAFTSQLFAQSTEILPGSVIPEMTKAQRTSSSGTFTNGMLVYDKTEGYYYYRRAGAWEKLSTSSSGWDLSGNNITVGDFIGSVNDQDLIFKVNDEIAGRISNTSFNNISFGTEALNFNTTGKQNIAIGFRALYLNTEGDNNIANGYGALRNNSTGKQNIANGPWTLYLNTEGDNNIANGYSALRNNTIGRNNIANGYGALYSNTEGIDNIANGYQTLRYNTTGINNIANGYLALHNNTTGKNNIANGYLALNLSTDGENNIANGPWALRFITEGHSNIAHGYASLYLLTKGNRNIAIGTNAGNKLIEGSNNIVIGYNAQVPDTTGSNQLQLGNDAIEYAGVKKAWSHPSDRRYKKNIQTTSLGLDFVNQIRPVSYVKINDEKERPEYGFIAQEIEEVMKKAGIPTEGILHIDNEGMYSLRYNDFIAISVKAIQELSAENNNLKLLVEAQNNRFEKLEAALIMLLPEDSNFGEE